MNHTDKRQSFVRCTAETTSMPDRASCTAVSGSATIETAPVDPWQPDTHAGLTKAPINTGFKDARAVQEHPLIYTQMRAVITGLGCPEHTTGVLLDSWRKLCEFLEERSTLPDRLEHIEPWELVRFSMHCWQSPPDDADALLLALVMLRVLLVKAEYHRTALAALIADIRRIEGQDSPVDR